MLSAIQNLENLLVTFKGNDSLNGKQDGSQPNHELVGSWLGSSDSGLVANSADTDKFR